MRYIDAVHTVDADELGILSRRPRGYDAGADESILNARSVHRAPRRRNRTVTGSTAPVDGVRHGRIARPSVSRMYK